eukprot:COSAG01_NODE_99_length_26583_cov_79.512536_14_plen_182_part_00
MHAAKPKACASTNAWASRTTRQPRSCTNASSKGSQSLSLLSSQPVLCNADRLVGCAGDRYSAAFNLYLNRKFTEALAGFEDLQVRVVSWPLVCLAFCWLRLYSGVSFQHCCCRCRCRCRCLPACLPAGRPVSISRQAVLASDFQAPPDRATEVLIKRVKQFIDNPPGEDWDGVDKVKSKAG